jgi:hypothetical protein
MASWALRIAAALWMASCAPAVRSPAPPPASVPAASRAARLAQRTQARAAHDRGDWTACAALFEQAERRYEAMDCYARGGRLDAAFAAAARVSDGELRGLPADSWLTDADLATLRGDPRWPPLLAQMIARSAALRSALDAELAQIYADDQADRNETYEKIDWSKVTPRDQARRKRVDEILAAGGARLAEDFYNAAMIYQHGESSAEIERAHGLALEAVALDPEHEAARWLAAASEDRVLLYAYKAQKWGTQYKKVDGHWIIWPVDPAITDAQRAAWGVQPLAAAQVFVDRMNASGKPAK